MEKRKPIQKFSDMKSKETKQCPYCGEEILAVAKKCKYCGEWLDKDEDSDNDEEQNVDKEEEEVFNNEPSASNMGKKILKRIAGTIVFLVVACLMFESGGWKVAWGGSIPHSKQWVVKEARRHGEVVAPKDRGFLLYRDGVLVRVNRKYYGFVKNKRHFDAPAIQWIMLVVAISVFGSAIYFLFTGKIDDV